MSREPFVIACRNRPSFNVTKMYVGQRVQGLMGRDYKMLSKGNPLVFSFFQKLLRSNIERK